MVLMVRQQKLNHPVIRRESNLGNKFQGNWRVPRNCIAADIPIVKKYSIVIAKFINFNSALTFYGIYMFGAMTSQHDCLKQKPMAYHTGLI
jgi:hypothetical protein